MSTKKKVAIITGASSGIGKVTAMSLHKAGYTVYGGARQVESMKDLADAGMHMNFLDLTEPTSITSFVQNILDNEGRIDVLVNCAGYGSYGAAEDVSLDEARRQFEVNVFGLAAMTNAVLSTMRKQGSGKLVHVGSIGGQIWSTMGTWYQATKFALEGYADCTRNELRPFGIDVILIQPGAIKSEWRNIAVKSIQKNSGSTVYRPLADAAVKFFTDSEDMECDPKIIADAIMKGVTAKKPKARYVAPSGAKAFLFFKRFMSDAMLDVVLSRFMKIPKTVKTH